MLRGPPQAADDRLGGVVGILGCALKRRVFRRGRDVRQVLADLLPAGAEALGARQREAVLRQVRGPEADEAKKGGLLLRGGGLARLVQFLREPDGGDVVARPGRPPARKRAVRVQIIIGPACGSGAARGNGNGVRVLMVRRRGSVVPGRLERPAQGCAVEQAERVLRGVRHGDDLRACARVDTRSFGGVFRARLGWGRSAAYRGD